MKYILFEEPINRDILGCWEKHMWSYTKIIGYSATGTLFLMCPDTMEFMVFYPSMSTSASNCKGYGKFDTIQNFEKIILKDDSFEEYLLYPIDPDDLNLLQNQLGPLDKNQIYYPKLDPALGGSLELDGFDKGDIWVRTEILGANRGVE